MDTIVLEAAITFLLAIKQNVIAHKKGVFIALNKIFYSFSFPFYPLNLIWNLTDSLLTFI